VAVYDVVVVDVVVVDLIDFDWVLIMEWCMGVWGGCGCDQRWEGLDGWMMGWCDCGYQRGVLLPAFWYGWFRYLLENG
jgi:hypothetical protein